jgi:hypothetical protein
VKENNSVGVDYGERAYDCGGTRPIFIDDAARNVMQKRSAKVIM